MVRSVDIRKSDGTHRRRLVAKNDRPKTHVDDIDGLSASTPLLQLVKLMIALVVESCRGGKCRNALLVNIGRAQLCARIQNDMYVELASEMHEDGKCATLECMGVYPLQHACCGGDRT